MNKIELFQLAHDKLEEQMCCRVSDKQFIYQAYCYAETRSRVEFKVKYAYDDLLEHDKLSDELEDYCLAVLSGNPEPNMKYIRNYNTLWIT